MLQLDNYPFKTKPFEHQLRELKAHGHKQAWAHFWEMGTGKSKVVLDNVGALYLEGKVDTLVITTYKGVYATWAYSLIPEHLPDSIPREVVMYSTYVMMLNRGKKAVESLLLPGTKRLKIFIINVEAITSDAAKRILTQIYRQAKGVFLCVDESTCIKTYSSARSKAVYNWAAKSHYRRLLSGTPSTGRAPMDLWGQSLVLGRGLFGTTNFTSFRGTFAEEETSWIARGGKMVPIKSIVGAKNTPLLMKYLDLFSTRLTKAECLDLPEKVYNKIPVELTTQQRQAYDKLRDEAMLEFEDKTLEVTHALTLITKLHQVACGQLKLEDGETVIIDNNRVEVLLDLLEPYQGKVIIWASYRQSLTEVLGALRHKYGHESVVDYYGDTTEEKRRQAVTSFQDPNSSVRFFVGNPQTGGYGLTLTAANLVVYYSNNYRLDVRMQSEDRAHRIGQTSKVTYLDLYSPGTVDERIMELLRAKKDLADVIMGQSFRSWL